MLHGLHEAFRARRRPRDKLDMRVSADNFLKDIFPECRALSTNLDQHALHLVRNLIALFRSAAVHQSHPVVDLFHFSRDCSASNVVWTAAGGFVAGTMGLLRLRNCRLDPCDESCYDDVHVLCVDFLLQELSHLY